MKILIITTYFPPDTAIAAVRPYMFAKYLKKLGHEVTVLRSGEIGHGFSSFYKIDPSTRVLSFFGSDSPAERYERGENMEEFLSGRKGKLHFLPASLRSFITKLYFLLFGAPFFSKVIKDMEARVEKQKKVLDSLKDEQFDVVFSTYGLAENILAGQYAAQLFNCPLIQDFRDTLANRQFQNRRQYSIYKKMQDEAVRKADAVTAVSEGVLREICDKEPHPHSYVLYNGFEPVEDASFDSKTKAGELSFCYTGQLYGGMRDFSPLLKALKKLADEDKIDLNKVRIHYAGRDFDFLHQQAEKYRLTEILENHGLMQREEVAALQAQTDMFVVLSWNTQKSQGVLTGKFYEGIRAGKPILSVVAGEVPHSELDLINEKYRYGFCYEVSREKEQFDLLCEYLEKAYCAKINTGAVEYKPEPALAEDFRYDILAKKLENICLELPHTSK